MTVHVKGIESGVVSLVVINESKRHVLYIPRMLSSQTHKPVRLNGIDTPYYNVEILVSGTWRLMDDFHPAHPRGYAVDEVNHSEEIMLAPKGRYDFYIPELPITNKWRIGIGGDFDSCDMVGAHSEEIEAKP